MDDAAAVTIVRAKHTARFTTLSNELCQNRYRLSPNARAVLIELISRPQDWHISLDCLAKNQMIGRDQASAALKELKARGFARLVTLRDPATGRLAGRQWIITEEPDEAAAPPARADIAPAREHCGTRADRAETHNQELVHGENYRNHENPNVGENRTSVKSGVIYKEQTKEQKTDSPTNPAAPLPGPREREKGLSEEEGKASRPSPRDEAWSRFEAAWTFGLGESRGGARKAFDRLNAADREAAISGAAAFQGAMAGRTHPPHASTYLAERKWTYPPRSATTSVGAPPPTASSPPAGAPAPSASKITARPRDDGSWWLDPSGPELARWNEFERKKLGRAKLGCIRPTQWPPSLNAARADRAAEGRPAAPFPTGGDR